jgi:hypothetical protein
VQVLQDQQQRRAHRETGQQPEHPHEQAVPGRKHVPRAIVGDEPFSLAPECGNERSVGQRRSGYRRRLTDAYLRTGSGSPRLAGQLLHQPGLAHAGRTGEQQHLRLAR